MGNRFDDLEQYLPPAARPPERDGDEAASRPTRRLRRRTRVLRAAHYRRMTLLTIVVFAVLGGSFALAQSVLRGSSALATADRADLGPRRDVSLGETLVTPDRPSRQFTRKQQGRLDVRRIAKRIRVTRPAGSEAAVSGSISEPVAAPEPRVRAARDHKNRVRARKPPPPKLPEPPRTSLFDCYKSRTGHYMTTDQSRVGQMDAPGTGWDCNVIGYVYGAEAPNTTPIQLDEEIVYVFERRATGTDPECKKVALYRHSTGHDLWYSTAEADGGLVGYMAV